MPTPYPAPVTSLGIHFTMRSLHLAKPGMVTTLVMLVSVCSD